MRRYHRQDPYWTKARFNSVCVCGVAIQEGGEIFYYPPHRSEKGTAVCADCGRKGSSDLQDEILNEQFNVC